MNGRRLFPPDWEIAAIWREDPAGRRSPVVKEGQEKEGMSMRFRSYDAAGDVDDLIFQDCWLASER